MSAMTMSGGGGGAIAWWKLAIAGAVLLLILYALSTPPAVLIGLAVFGVPLVWFGRGKANLDRVAYGVCVAGFATLLFQVPGCGARAQRTLNEATGGGNDVVDRWRLPTIQVGGQTPVAPPVTVATPTTVAPQPVPVPAGAPSPGR